MKRFLPLWLGLGLGFLAARPALAQPANNNFASRTVLTGAQISVGGTTVNATREAGEPGPYNNMGPSVWYEWTPAFSTTASVAVTGNFRECIGVYTGTAVNGLTQIATGTALNGQTSCSLTFAPTPGVTYKIFVAGRQAQSGTFTLSISQTVPISISITAPTNGATFAQGTPITVSATATSGAGTVTQVVFYAGGTVIGVDTNLPFSINWTNAPLGSNGLYAVMTDSASQTLTSAVVSAWVVKPGVTITSPTNGAVQYGVASVTVATTNLYAQPPATVAKVEFFVNGTTFGQSAASPWQATWTSPVEGTNVFFAIMTDSASATYTSAPVRLAIILGQTLVAAGSVWKYLDTGADLGTAWVVPGFGDSLWASGPAVLGYGNGTEATVVSYGPSATNKYITTYFRQSFVVTNIAGCTNLILRVKRDDGAVVYLNGVEAARFNLPAGTVTYTNLAYNALDDGTVFFPVNVSPSLLVEGTNVLAVEVHQTSVSSSDLAFDLHLLAQRDAAINLPPAVSFLSPTNGQPLLGPANLTLTATATDPDGSVASVEFFSGGASLGLASVGNPFSLVWPNVGLGSATLTAVATDNHGAKATSAPVAITLWSAPESRWAAFNEQTKGPGSSAYTTPYTIAALGANSGSMSNIVSGAALPVTLTVTNAPGYEVAGTMGTPNTGTPAYTIFNGYIDWYNSGASANGIHVYPTNAIGYTFSGLNPNKAYTLIATSVRAGSGAVAGNEYSNRWLMAELKGAASWVPAHSTGVITSNQFPADLTGGQVAFNSGINTSGEVVQWQNIIPGSGGTFTLFTKMYRGAFPGGNGTNALYTFGMTALRLEEFAPVPLVSVTNPTSGAVFLAPGEVPVTATASGFGGVTNLQILGNGALLGASVSSPLSLVWSNVPAGSNGLQAVAFDTQGGRATSSVVSITILSSTNPPLVVNLTSPTNGASFSNGFSIPLTAVASNSAGTVTLMEFFDGLTKLGESLTGPLFSLTWSNANAGSHPLLAVATDSLGTKGTSAPVNITVLGNQAPTVAITNPVNGASFVAPANFAISATAADSDGTVTNVAFYAGTTLLGRAPTAPYTIFSTNVAAGNYALTAVASDNGGQRTTSAPVNITVTSPSVPLLITYDFSTLPAATNWSTYAIAGAAATLTTSAQLDTAVQALTASLITTPLGSTNVNPPVAAGTAFWSSTGGYVQTRPTGNNGIALMCTLINGSGSAVLAVNIAYDYALVATNGVAEEIPGHLVYYSLTGLANSWVQIPAFSLQTTAGRLSTVVNLSSSWAGGTPLYLLWADDNGSGSPDWAVQIDNFAVSDDRAAKVQITSPGNNTLVVLPTNLVLTAIVSGFTNSVVTNVAFYNGAAKLGDTTVAPYNYTWSAVTTGSYTLRAVARDNVGLAVTSSPVAITVISNLPPTVAISSPADSAFFSTPTDVPITVNASDSADGGRVTNVVYYANGVKIGESASVPFAFTWLNPATNAYNLTAVAYDEHGAPGTSAVVRVYVIQSSAPTVVSFTPASGSLLSDLTWVMVTFDQPVNGVDAPDLLVNNVPALAVSGTGAAYTFSFAPPAEGVVLLTWANGHGIVNQEVVPKGFDGTRTSAMASYTVRDTIPPSLVNVGPAPGATLSAFTTLTLTFDEVVTGVSASNLLINGVAATKVTGVGPYVFEFAQPAAGAVTVSWAEGQAIRDLALPPNAFVAGSPWTFTLDPAVNESAVVINEIYYHAPSEVDGDAWVELLNTGSAVVNLTGWHLKGTGFYFPDMAIQPGSYLVVASDLARFGAKYPGVTNVVGGGTEPIKKTLALWNAQGTVVNTVSYAKSGDWGERLLGSGEERALTLTRSGSTATVTWGGFLNNGDTVVITGADQPEYNGTFTAAGAIYSSFTYTVSGSPATPATSVNGGAIRVRLMTDWSKQGWAWSSRADGLGSSLELVNPALPMPYAQNWRANNTNGTPGRANTVATNNAAPLILNVAHYPLVPRSTNAITITAQILDEHATGVTATLWWRLDALSGSPAFTTTNLLDDGLHGDGVAGDGVFGAVLPPQTNNAIVEFYVTATDAEGNTRAWPAPALDANRSPLAATSSANALLQVDNNTANDYSGTFPVYKLIMKAADTNYYLPFPSTAPQSDATMNTTFIAFDGTSTECIYLCGVRDRGAGSRSRQPANHRVSYPDDHQWHGLGSIELNTQYTHAQMVGYALALQAGVTAEWARMVNVRVNNFDRASSGSPQYGHYIQLTSTDTSYAKNHFPDDPSGNLYRCQGRGLYGTTLHMCNLSYLGTNWTSYANIGYAKQSNMEVNDWNDLANLCLVLNTNPPDDTVYAAAVQKVVNVEDWMRCFALFTLMTSRETAMPGTGCGDDFTMYRGVNDPRFRLLAHDFDTILNEGDTTGGYTDSTFRFVPSIMNSTNTNPGPNVTALNRFFKHPDFVPFYFRELYRQGTNFFAPIPLRKTLNDTIGSFASGQINNMVNYSSNRLAYVLSQIPTNFTVNTGLGTSGGFYYTTSPTLTLNGSANALAARYVTVNGAASVWSAWEGRWTNTLTLNPGVNHLLVEARDTNNMAFASTNVDVWYDVTGTSVSGAVSGAMVWTAASGPYRVTANLTVGNGAVLTIQPGTTVFFGSGVTVTVSGSGQVLANGTAAQHIRFTKVSSGANWGSFDLVGATNESRLAYVDFDSCGGTTIGSHNAQLHINNSVAFIDHCTWPSTPVIEYISFDASSFIVQNCTFPTYPPPTGPESLHGINGIPAGGYGIFRDNYFGHTWGFNDTIDFTGGNRPGPILQFINNVFDGASDDCLDLDSTDAWIEGNVFMHVHRDPARTDNALDTGSAISGGVDFIGQNSDWTIINNLFYDVDHVFLNKGNSTTTPNGGGRVAFLYNTVIHVAKEYSGSTAGEIAVFDWSDDDIAPPAPDIGSGMYAAHNIIYDAPTLQRFYYPTSHTVLFDHNIFPAAFAGTSNEWTGAGSGNQYVDPRLNLSVLSDTFATNVTVAQLRQAAQLLPGSPALGAGFGGRDLGGLNPFGIALAGELEGTVGSTSATLIVGPGGTFNWGTVGPQAWGYTAFKWKLDNGAWSAEIGFTNNSPFTNLPTISLSGLGEGPHTVYVSGKNDAPPGYYQDDTFVYPSTAGVPAHATASHTWYVQTNAVLLRINEVLAANETAVPVNGKYPDLIELHNPGASAVDLTGMSLSDDPNTPTKFVFPPGSAMAAGQYLVLYADNASTPAGHHLGFGLNQEGEAVYLYDAGGRTLDAVMFGPQVADHSIGRLADGSWTLCVPTFGAANVAAVTGDAHKLKINEWLTAAFDVYASDFLELYNPDTRPVSLGGCYLSSVPGGAPDQHQLAALSFIAASGYVVFQTDASPTFGATHLNFKLNADRGEIGLFDTSLKMIDYVLYGPQRTDVPQGRSPNGSTNIMFLVTATPGSPNPAPALPVGSQIVLNEVLVKNITVFTNIDGGTPSWIEIYNPTPSLVDLSDLSLSTNVASPRAFVFPAGTTLAVGGYLVVTFDPSLPASTNAESQPNTGFGLKDNGGSVYLYDKLANGGSLLDSLAYGVQANDYSVGRSPNGGTNWTLTLPTIGMANIAATTGDRTQVRINEWMASNPNGADWFELYNPNPQPVNLSGLYLTDDVSTPVSRQKFQIAPLSYLGEGLYGYQRFWADKIPSAGPEHVNFKLKAAGGLLGLYAPGDVQIDAVAYGAQTSGVSQGRLPDGSANLVFFPTTATPGDANYLPLPNVVINEVLTAIPSNGSLEQAIELLNTGGAALDVSGWWLSHQLHHLQQYQFPSGTTLPAGGFLVVYADQLTGDLDPIHRLVLDAVNGDQVYLSAATPSGALTGYRTDQSFGPAAPGVSLGRYTNSVGNVDFTALGATTFGHDSPDGVADFRLGTGLPNAYPLVGPVVVSEIMYHPFDLPGGTNNLRDEFIELHNPSANSVPLYDPANPANTWHVRGGVSYDFPANVTLPAGGYLLVVSFDPVADTNSLAGFQAAYPQLSFGTPIYGPYSGALGNNGDTVELNQPGTPVAGVVPRLLVEHIKYHQSAPWPIAADGFGFSLQRLSESGYGNDPTNWLAAVPTPGPQTVVVDTDGDGIPDWWMQLYFGHPTGQAGDLSRANDDPDHDGLTNLQEYWAGTDPTSAASVLSLQPVNTGLDAGTNAVFSFPGVAEQSYTVQFSDTLPLGWTNLISLDPLSSSGPIWITNQVPAGTAQRFYRVVTPRLP